jgi:hypothetical protein
MSVLRRWLAATAALTLTALATGAAAAEVQPGAAEGAELVKTGWWWAGNETPLDETVVAPPQSGPPNVPKGALPVAAAAGEPEKISAIEFAVDAEPGDVVASAMLALRESPAPGATVNAESATILACPVTERFWADGSAAAWKARPAYDCDLAGVPGERGEDGVWTFDLTGIAALWLSEDHPGSSSLVLVEGAEPPEGFQVSFDGPAAEGVGYRFEVTKGTGSTGETPPVPPAGAATGGATPGGTAGGGAGTSSPTATGGSTDFTAGAASGGSLSGVSGSADAPMVSNADLSPVEPGELPAATAADAAPAGEASVAAAPAATTPVAAVTPPWYSGLPTGSLLLLPLVLGLGYLMMLALGPDAQPAAGPSQRGVGRALERLRTAGASLTTRGQS